MHIPPDWGIFAALIVSFLLFWFIFGWLFFSPFLKLLGERERRLTELNERAQRLLQEERSAVEEREEQLAAVRRQALEQARSQSRNQLEQVRAEIEQEFNAAGRQLEESARLLAAELAGRILGRPLTVDGRALRNN
jgi:F0F1-type ATP synthase membrane subunit b/b'